LVAKTIWHREPAGLLQVGGQINMAEVLRTSGRVEEEIKKNRCKIISSKGFFHGKIIEKMRVEVVGDE